MLRWIEEHPYLAGGTLLALVFLLIVIRNRSAQAATSAPAASPYGVDPSMQALEVQSGNQLTALQLQAQSQVAGYQAALNAKSLDTSAAVTLAQIQAQVETQGILSQTDTTNNQTGAELALGMIQAGANPIFTADLGGFHFGGSTPATVPTIPVPPTPQPVGGIGTQPARILAANDVAATIAAGAGATQINLPAGAYTLTNPQGSFPSDPLSFMGPAPGQSYADFRAAAFPRSCSPMDPTCIADQTAVQIAANEAWTAHEYAPIAPAPAPTNVSPSLSGSCAMRAGGPNACPPGVA